MRITYLLGGALVALAPIANADDQQQQAAPTQQQAAPTQQQRRAEEKSVLKDYSMSYWNQSERWSLALDRIEVKKKPYYNVRAEFKELGKNERQVARYTGRLAVSELAALEAAIEANKDNLEAGFRVRVSGIKRDEARVLKVRTLTSTWSGNVDAELAGWSGIDGLIATTRAITIGLTSQATPCPDEPAGPASGTTGTQQQTAAPAAPAPEAPAPEAPAPETTGVLGALGGATGSSQPAAPETTAPVAAEVFRKGSRGAAVATIQAQLRLLGFPIGKCDGIFGDKTEAAVKEFQTTHGIATTGAVGGSTRQAIENLFVRQVPTLKLDARGGWVEKLHAALEDSGAPLATHADGVFGFNTETAVKAFQKAQGLTVDGVVGRRTWIALMKAQPE